MIRTLQEMEESDALYGSSVDDVFTSAVVAGDYLRARRRRFPLNLVVLSSDKDNVDGFEGETGRVTTNTVRFFLYEKDSGNPYYFYIFDSHKEYVDD